MDLPVGSAFMLRLGIHAVSATAVDFHGDTVGPVTFCFTAKGGASYLLQFAGETHRVPLLIDERTASEVETPPLLPGGRCAPPAPPPAEGALRAARPPMAGAAGHPAAQ
jgi:hypothetical protein